MGLFGRAHLSVEEVERALKRPLTGDPSRGERGVLSALRADRVEEVRRLLDRDGSLASDFKQLVADHLFQAARARESLRAWRVQLPVAVWEEYARESAATRLPLAECLGAAIERDYDRRQRSLDPIDALDARVRAYHTAAAAILDELKRGLDAAGSLHEIRQALRRLEDVLARNAAAAARR